jgi:hypothetical protein
MVVFGGILQSPKPPPLVGGPELKYLSSAPFFHIFGPTAVLKIFSFQALALDDNIADLLQLWHQQPVLQIVTLTHSPACNSGSSAEMLCQFHWKTQIKGLTKWRFVPLSVHRARVCIRGSRWDQCHAPPYFFLPHTVNVLPPPPEQRIHPTGPPPHRTNFPKGSSCHQLAGSNTCAFFFLGVHVAIESNFEQFFLHDVDAVARRHSQWRGK